MQFFYQQFNVRMFYTQFFEIDRQAYVSEKMFQS